MKTIAQRLHELAKHLETASLPPDQVARLLHAEAESVAYIEGNIADMHHAARLAQDHATAMALYLAKITPGQQKSKAVDGA